jgi:hypothetical protein
VPARPCIFQRDRCATNLVPACAKSIGDKHVAAGAMECATPTLWVVTVLSVKSFPSLRAMDGVAIATASYMQMSDLDNTTGAYSPARIARPASASLRHWLLRQHHPKSKVPRYWRCDWLSGGCRVKLLNNVTSCGRLLHIERRMLDFS